MVAFTIAFNILRKNIKIKLTFSKFVVKPILATLIMAICSYFVFMMLSGIIVEKVAIIITILFAVLIYGISIIALNIFTKEEMYMIPYGQKLYAILQKVGIYNKN